MNGDELGSTRIEENVEEWAETNSMDEDISGCGELELGRYYLDDYETKQGNMVLDELIIWEVQISAKDVKNLYDAYESSSAGFTPPSYGLSDGDNPN